jgi:hypothetical protein
MPHPPEPFKSIIIDNTSSHIIDYLNPFDVAPNFSPFPDNIELVPDVKQ